MEEWIKKSDAIKALNTEARKQFRLDDSYAYVIGTLRNVENAINSIPSADTDISEYSDKLWRNAYERGKADRPQGEWNFIGDNLFECTSCGEVYSTRQFEMMRNRTTDPLFPKGCPHCGERMKGADDD